MREYTRSDVEMMLRASTELNRQQADIQKFLALLEAGLPSNHELLKLNIQFNDTKGGIYVEIDLIKWSTLLVDVRLGRVTHHLRSVDGYNPLKPAFIGVVWRHLPEVLNAVAEKVPAVPDYVEFLRRVQG